MKLSLDIEAIKRKILSELLQDKLCNIDFSVGYEEDKYKELKMEIERFKEAYPQISATIASKNVINVTELIMKRAIEYTPYNTGKLVNSIKLLVDTNPYNGELAYCIAYDCEYATYVHEIAQYKHDKGRYKFLESAAFDIIKEYQESIGWYISIEYNPLRLYINSPNHGVPLNQIKRNLDYMSSEQFNEFMDKMLEVRGKGVLPDNWLNTFFDNYFSKYDLFKNNTDETKKNFIDRIRSYVRF